MRRINHHCPPNFIQLLQETPWAPKILVRHFVRAWRYKRKECWWRRNQHHNRLISTTKYSCLTTRFTGSSLACPNKISQNLLTGRSLTRFIAIAKYSLSAACSHLHRSLLISNKAWTCPFWLIARLPGKRKSWRVYTRWLGDSQTTRATLGHRLDFSPKQRFKRAIKKLTWRSIIRSWR